MNESPTLRDEMLELLRPFTIGITKVLFLSSLCDRRDLHLISRILSLACLPHMLSQRVIHSTVTTFSLAKELAKSSTTREN